MKTVEKNGNIYAGKELAGKTIQVKMIGYKHPVWSRVRSNGIANVGRKWAGWECEIQVVEAMPAIEKVV